MPHGLLLFAHGARDPRWARPFEAVAARIAGRRPELIVALGFLEFMSPDLQAAGLGLAEAGCTRIDVLPLFLGAGGHVRRDLPAALEALRLARPAVSWHLHEAVGEMQSVIDAMAEAAIACTAGVAPAADTD